MFARSFRASLFTASFLTTLALTGVAQAQATPDPYTTAARYDAAQRLVGTISPDPDGAGPLKFRAVRNTYDGAGRLVREEQGTLGSWQTEAVAPASWAGFEVISETDTSYDVMGRKISELRIGHGGLLYALTQYSYDSVGRLECTAVRMNPSRFSDLSTAACTLGDQGTYGPDRISRNQYWPDGQLKSVTSGYGVDPIIERQATYTPNGKLSAETDGVNNTTTYAYDDFDRLQKTTFPSPVQGAGSQNDSDFEQYGYDANSNRTSVRRRDGNTIVFGYDALNRLRTKSLSPTAATPASSYIFKYDNLGDLTSASVNGVPVKREYDGFGRLKSETTGLGTLSYDYDAASRRVRMSWPGSDNFYVTYDYDETDALKAVRRAGSLASADLIAQVSYDDLGRRASLTRNGVSSTYTYGTAGRLAHLQQDLAGTADDVTFDYTYNPANELIRKSSSNPEYAWMEPIAADRTYSANGLNQQTSVNSQQLYYSLRGNLSSDGSNNFKYDLENRLRGTTNTGISLDYDAFDRLTNMATQAGSETYAYDASDIIGEYNASGGADRRYVRTPGGDEVLAILNSGGGMDRPVTDPQHSVIALADANGYVEALSSGKAINRYDEYGNGAATNVGLFRYTGEPYLGPLGVYHLRTRAYSPSLGRFLQPDIAAFRWQPEDSDEQNPSIAASAGSWYPDPSLNLYAYVEDDPANSSDPSGECPQCFIGAAGGALAGLGGQIVADVATHQVSSAGTYLGAVTGGAVGGAVFAASGGNATAAGFVGGAVSGAIGKGVDAAVAGGSGRQIFQAASKGALFGAGTGAVFGAGGKYLAAGGKGALAQAAQRSALGRSIANNERMTTMMAGRMVRGAVNLSERTGYKMIAGSATASLGSSAAGATACGVAKQC